MSIYVALETLLVPLLDLGQQLKSIETLLSELSSAWEYIGLDNRSHYHYDHCSKDDKMLKAEAEHPSH